MSLFTEEGNYNCVITNDASKLRPRPVKKLLIRLISGHHLPKSADQKIKGNVIQPYVSLKLRGHVLDEAEFTTEVIPKVRNYETQKIPKEVTYALLYIFRTGSIQFGKVALNFTWFIPNLHSWNFKYVRFLPAACRSNPTNLPMIL